MRKSLLTIALFTTLSGFAQEKVQCTGTTKAGNRCKITAWNNSNLCWRHNPNYKKDNSVSVVCSGTTKSGNPCKVKTKHSSGICHHHRD